MFVLYLFFIAFIGCLTYLFIYLLKNKFISIWVIDASQPWGLNLDPELRLLSVAFYMLSLYLCVLIYTYSNFLTAESLNSHFNFW